MPVKLVMFYYLYTIFISKITWKIVYHVSRDNCFLRQNCQSYV